MATQSGNSCCASSTSSSSRLAANNLTPKSSLSSLITSQMQMETINIDMADCDSLDSTYHQPQITIGDLLEKLFNIKSSSKCYKICEPCYQNLKFVYVLWSNLKKIKSNLEQTYKKTCKLFVKRNGGQRPAKPAKQPDVAHQEQPHDLSIKSLNKATLPGCQINTDQAAKNELESSSRRKRKSLVSVVCSLPVFGDQSQTDIAFQRPNHFKQQQPTEAVHANNFDDDDQDDPYDHNAKRPKFNHEAFVAVMQQAPPKPIHSPYQHFNEIIYDYNYNKSRLVSALGLSMCLSRHFDLFVSEQNNKMATEPNGLLMKHDHKPLIETLVPPPSQQKPLNPTMHAMEYILNGFNVLRKIKSKSRFVSSSTAHTTDLIVPH
jgi:hypothetical protein